MHTRSHMTKRKALSLRKSYKQSDEEFKPVGLWYSLDDEWAEWCWCSMPQWITKYSHYLEVDLSRILVIETPEDLQKFEDEFSIQIRQSRFRSLNWKSVAEKYSGIEIRNYHQLKSHRDASYLARLWFYGWDISGGCVWDLSCIKTIRTEETPRLSQINLQETD